MRSCSYRWHYYSVELLSSTSYSLALLPWRSGQEVLAPSFGFPLKAQTKVGHSCTGQEPWGGGAGLEEVATTRKRSVPWIPAQNNGRKTPLQACCRQSRASSSILSFCFAFCFTLFRSSRSSQAVWSVIHSRQKIWFLTRSSVALKVLLTSLFFFSRRLDNGFITFQHKPEQGFTVYFLPATQGNTYYLLYQFSNEELEQRKWRTQVAKGEHLTEFNVLCAGPGLLYGL